MFPRRPSRRVVAGATALVLAASIATTLTDLTTSAAATTPSTVTTLAPVADTMVTSGAPGANYGHWVQLQASTMPGHRKLAYLKFKIPPFAGRRITSAVLYVT